MLKLWEKYIYLCQCRCKELKMLGLQRREAFMSQREEVHDKMEHSCQKLLDLISAALFRTKTNCLQ